MVTCHAPRQRFGLDPGDTLLWFIIFDLVGWRISLMGTADGWADCCAISRGY